MITASYPPWKAQCCSFSLIRIRSRCWWADSSRIISLQTEQPSNLTVLTISFADWRCLLDSTLAQILKLEVSCWLLLVYRSLSKGLNSWLGIKYLLVEISIAFESHFQVINFLFFVSKHQSQSFIVISDLEQP